MFDNTILLVIRLPLLAVVIIVLSTLCLDKKTPIYSFRLYLPEQCVSLPLQCKLQSSRELCKPVLVESCNNLKIVWCLDAEISRISFHQNLVIILVLDLSHLKDEQNVAYRCSRCSRHTDRDRYWLGQVGARTYHFCEYPMVLIDTVVLCIHTTLIRKSDNRKKLQFITLLTAISIVSLTHRKQQKW